jgi:Sec-independent protein secretion pathway component TatC
MQALIPWKPWNALATALLITGLCFGYFVALPAALKFLTTDDSGSFAIHIRASSYYGFALTVLVAMLIFELPLFILGLARIGAVDSKKLRARSARVFRGVRSRRCAPRRRSVHDQSVRLCRSLVLFEASIWAVAWNERVAELGSLRTSMSR